MFPDRWNESCEVPMLYKNGNIEIHTFLAISRFSLGKLLENYVLLKLRPLSVKYIFLVDRQRLQEEFYNSSKSFEEG